MSARPERSRIRAGAAVAALGVACLALASFGTGRAFAEQRLAGVFERANQAASRGDYPRAIDLYRTLVDAGVDDPDVYYDLATAYARADQYGQAILYFERTLARRPGDDGAERGLAAAREALGRRRAQRTGEALVDAGPPFPEVLVRDVSSDALAWAVLALDVLLFALLIVRRFVHGDSARLALGVAAPVAALLLALAGFGLTVKEGWLREGRPGIVLEEGAVLREGPDDRAGERGEAFEGERVRVVDRHGGYLRVTLPAGREGWLEASEVGVI